jgi:hypothetical protein
LDRRASTGNSVPVVAHTRTTKTEATRRGIYVFGLVAAVQESSEDISREVGRGREVGGREARKTGEVMFFW